MLDRAHFQAALRQDFSTFFRRGFRDLEPEVPFSPNWHYEAQAHQLQRVFEGECTRLITNVPPRSGKSIMASVTWPMFVMGHRPQTRIICVSHTEDLAREFSIKRRQIAQSRWYQQAFPGMKLVGARDLELRTDMLGVCYASGVGGSILGRGADLIIVDDPLKGIDAFSEAARRRVNEFFDNTLVTRLNNKKTGAIVVIMQRLHENDLTGHVLGRGDWDVLSLPAIAHERTVHSLSFAPGDVHWREPGDVLQPEREPKEILEQTRRAQGALVFEAQYQQQPTPADGNIIKREWLSYYDEEPTNFDRVIVSWDTASTLGEDSDYSVGTVWGAVGLNYYLRHVIRVRAETPDLKRLIIETHAEWGADATLIEDADIGRGILQELRRSTDLRPIPIQPRLEKEARLLTQAVRFEGRQVHLPREAPWRAVYEKELLSFPLSAKKDQVDSTSQALDWLTARNATTRPLVRRESIPRREIVRR